ncbi:MAG TPA: hypothetical protein VGN16_21035 [Acidobacteriaceae bacterium]|jgi:hypothetical protein
MLPPSEKFQEIALDARIAELVDHAKEIRKALLVGHVWAADTWTHVALDKAEEIASDLRDLQRCIENQAELKEENPHA